MDKRIIKQAEALRAQAEYLRTTAALPAVDEYDVERLAEAEAFEAGANALDRLAALERELAEARKPCPCKVRDAVVDAAMEGSE